MLVRQQGKLQISKQFISSWLVGIDGNNHFTRIISPIQFFGACLYRRCHISLFSYMMSYMTEVQGFSCYLRWVFVLRWCNNNDNNNNNNNNIVFWEGKLMKVLCFSWKTWKLQQCLSCWLLMEELATHLPPSVPSLPSTSWCFLLLAVCAVETDDFI